MSGELRHIAEVIEEMKPLEAELPVCPEPTCRKVGPQPKGFTRIKNICNGGIHNPHPRRTMVYKLFREVQ